MKIVVNDVVATPADGGAYSILQDFYHSVENKNDGNEWYFIVSGPFLASKPNIHIIKKPELKTSKIKRLSFELFTGRRLINKINPDIYFSLQNTPTFGIKAKQFVYLHQPLNFVLSQHKFRFTVAHERRLAIYQRVFGRVINAMLKKSPAQVIVQTQWLKKELVQRKIKVSQNITVITPDVEIPAIYRVDQLDRAFCYPASPIAYKNHKMIVEVVRRLVEAGITDFKFYLTISEKELMDLGINNVPSQVICLGRIERNRVYSLLTKSALVFASSIETFGLPLLEARTIGTKIFSTNIPPAKEALDGYINVVFFKPNDVDQLQQLMSQWLAGSQKISVDTVKKTNPSRNQNLAEFLIGG